MIPNINGRWLLQMSLSMLGAMYPGSAVAGDGSCPWTHLPMRIREQALADGLNGGPPALIAAIPGTDLSSAELSCGLTKKNADALHRAESGFMLQVLAERWLAGNASLTPEVLDRAWRSMDTSAKASLESWARNLQHAPDVHERAYGAFMVQLGARATKLPLDIRPQVITYLQGRAFRSVFEPRY